MYNHTYKVSTPRLRGYQSQDSAVKKSSSSQLNHNKSIIAKLLFDKPSKPDQTSINKNEPKQ